MSDAWKVFRVSLLFACWAILHAFCRLLIFFKIIFFEKFFWEHYQSVKWFGTRSGPTLGPNCLQRLSADNKSRSYQGKS